MNKNEFVLFCKREFESYGFRKHNKMFYLVGQDLLCGIDLQKSNYGNTYYINFCFFIGDFHKTNPSSYPKYWDCDINERIDVISKKQLYHGEPFITGAIEYEEYTEDTLRPFFEKAFKTRILPPIHSGKRYILDNLGKLYSLELYQERVLKKLMQP